MMNIEDYYYCTGIEVHLRQEQGRIISASFSIPTVSADLKSVVGGPIHSHLSN